MRRRAYVRLLLAAVILTLIATTIAPDAIAPFLKHPNESLAVRHAEKWLFEAITRPPQVVARWFGIWIDSHSMQLWPAMWPMFLALAVRLAMISIPFWFLIGAIVFEMILAIRRWRT